jgi:hypothetical protein
MSDNIYSIIPYPNAEIVESSGVPGLFDTIRASWKAKNLITRTYALLKVDPSSACQRIFNAAIHDLREKVIIAGQDIAHEAAKQMKLPPISNDEDILRYSTSKLIDLCYAMGLLSRPEWKRLIRCYEIRRDLEHEDDEYIAGPEDCLYIFKTCIEVVLSRDPINLLKVTDVKEVVEKPEYLTPDITLLDDFEYAPQPRQVEIMKFLISISLDSSQPDLVRENTFIFLKYLSPISKSGTKLELAKDFNERLVKKPLDIIHARVAYASGLLPYVRKTKKGEFFNGIYLRMEEITYHWSKHSEHGDLLRIFNEVGGLEFCPDDVKYKVIIWLILAYIGEPGGYGDYGRHRSVFYSNSAAPIAHDLLVEDAEAVSKFLTKVQAEKDVKQAIRDTKVRQRFENLIDAIQVKTTD